MWKWNRQKTRGFFCSGNNQRMKVLWIKMAHLTFFTYTIWSKVLGLLLHIGTAWPWEPSTWQHYSVPLCGRPCCGCVAGVAKWLHFAITQLKVDDGIGGKKFHELTCCSDCNCYNTAVTVVSSLEQPIFFTHLWQADSMTVIAWFYSTVAIRL